MSLFFTSKRKKCFQNEQLTTYSCLTRSKTSVCFKVQNCALTEKWGLYFQDACLCGLHTAKVGGLGWWIWPHQLVWGICSLHQVQCVQIDNEHPFNESPDQPLPTARAKVENGDNKDNHNNCAFEMTWLFVCFCDAHLLSHRSVSGESFLLDKELLRKHVFANASKFWFRYAEKFLSVSLLKVAYVEFFTNQSSILREVYGSLQTISVSFCQTLKHAGGDIVWNKDGSSFTFAERSWFVSIISLI